MAPIEEVLLLSVGISFVLSVIYRVLTKPAEMKRVKEEVKLHRERMKKAQKEGNKAELSSSLSEMTKLNQKQLRGSMKPMLVSLLVFFVFVGFLRQTYVTFSIHLPTTLPLLSYSYPFIALRSSIGWFWWYILVTVPCTIVFRKLLGVE